MTVEQITEKIFSIEHRLTEVEDRAKSNTKRVNEHDEELKENQEDRNATFGNNTYPWCTTSALRFEYELD